MSRRRQHARPCPTATKTAFPSEAVALEKLAEITLEPDLEPREKKPLRAYRCECGRWHLTSSAKSYGGASDTATIAARIHAAGAA